jgi:TetR/AcrR family transcriptional regulator, tetracycline repressor protein
MEPLSPEEEKQRGLTRERLVAAALGLINEEGLEALSMRSLADSLDVKASSLYWHVRDRRELLELLADSILEAVGHTRQRSTWRQTVTAMSDALGRTVAAQKDAGRILMEAPEAIERSDAFAAVKAQLVAAGLQPAEAGDVALMLMTYVVTGRAPAEDGSVPASGEVASIAIDSGSRGVVLRAGAPDMQSLIRVPHDQAAAAPAVVSGEQVVVRRLRGVGKGEIELNPRHPWRIKVQAPTWNTRLDLGGLDVREIWVDSGAANLECFLPEPRGVVPIHISSGVVNVGLHRPSNAAVVAHVHTGAVKLRLEEFSTRVAVFDVHWKTKEAEEAKDRYALDVSSGAVDVKLDTYTPKARAAMVEPEPPRRSGAPASALEILLDGVESRTARA